MDLLLGALSRRGDRVDVVTFAEGADRAYPGVALHRIPRLPGLRGIRPGFSFKKLACDLFLLARALRLARRGRYDVVHAVEESVFMAMLIRLVYRVPYVFDMDSSMPCQLIEKYPVLAPLGPALRFFEGRAIHRALAVVPVCDALADIARRHAPRKVCLLRDVSLLAPGPAPGAAPDGAPPLPEAERPCLLYIGNLERYQGIDLLLDAFARLLAGGLRASLWIAGGTPESIRRYRGKAERLGIGARATFLGPWPVARMAELMAAADGLVSPRTQGGNTPMKIYSYLASGKPILATDLPTHTQVLTPEVAFLAAPEPAAFAEGLRQLIEHPEEGRARAGRARALADARYSPAAFDRAVGELYQWLETQTGRTRPADQDPAAPAPDKATFS